VKVEVRVKGEAKGETQSWETGRNTLPKLFFGRRHVFHARNPAGRGRLVILIG